MIGEGGGPDLAWVGAAGLLQAIRGMSVDIQEVEAIRDQTIVQMQALLATSGPTITVGTEQIAWAPLLESLGRTLDWCDRKLAEYQPFEVRSQAET